MRAALYENSLLLVMGSIWLGTWFAQSVTGWSTYNADQIEHKASEVSWLGYVGTADFWQDTLQNWQSEFLAIGSMAVLSIYLRQRRIAGVQARRRVARGDGRRGLKRATARSAGTGSRRTRAARAGSRSAGGRARRR